MTSKACLSILLFLAVWSCALCALPQKQWWETAIMYQIYPRSFKDTDNDGTGDLKGIIEKMDYFVELGVESIWIQPFNPSGDADLGYDVADYYNVDPIFGTMDDFDLLIAEAHERGIKVILDFVPNHTSDKHDWFKKSCEGIKPYDEFYVWKEGKVDPLTRKMIPPNNWVSIFGGPAWTYNEKRREYYLNQFSPKQPELNFRSDKLKKAVEDVLSFWLDKGIDGWRIDALKHLIEVSDFRDEPYKPGKEGSTLYDDMYHIYTTDQPELYDQLVEWRELIDSYDKKTGQSRMMVVESYTSLDYTMMYYQYKNKKGANYPFNFWFVGSMTKDTNASAVAGGIHSWLDNMPAGGPANWVYDNHDNPRVVGRVGKELANGMIMMTQILPGVQVTYFGDEIGMEDGVVRTDERKDPNNAGGARVTETRDPERCPMQWDDSINGGFSKADKPWLPVNPNYWIVNVEAQRAAEWSSLKIYKAMSRLRKTDTLIHGELATHVMNDEWVLAISRTLPGYDRYIFVVNLNSKVEEVNLSGKIGGISDSLYVVVPSINAGYQIGQRVVSNPHFDSNAKIVLRPRASIVLVQTVDGKPPKIPSDIDDPVIPKPTSGGSKNALHWFLLAGTVFVITMLQKL